MIELGELRVFITAAEECSFSKAACRLHLSQSAVSQNIQNLEKRFGVTLFVRNGRSVWLSEAGQALLPMARSLIDSGRLLEETMNNVDSEVVGELVIGCSTTSGKYLLPKIVARFRRHYPGVRVRINVLARNEVINRLKDGRHPFGVISSTLISSHFEQYPLFQDEVILVVPAGHPWGEFGRALPSDLLDQPMIFREPDAGTAEAALEALSKYGITRESLNIVLEIGNSEAIAMAVEEGIGIAFISRLAAARGLALGTLKHVIVDGLDLRRNITMLRGTLRPMSRAEDRFWTFLHDEWPGVCGALPPATDQTASLAFNEVC